MLKSGCEWWLVACWLSQPSIFTGIVENHAGCLVGSTVAGGEWPIAVNNEGYINPTIRTI